MSYSIKMKLLIAGLIAFAMLGRVGCYYADKQYDTVHRPWAYSDDPNKPLLVGKWQGSVADPDGKLQQVVLEIVLPTSDEERMARFATQRSKGNSDSPTFFDGIAIIEANERRDSCEIWGGLDDADGHQIHFQFRPVDDMHAIGFNLTSAEGNWQGNMLELTAGFTFFQENGASYYDSTDPRYEQKGLLKMSRKLE